MSLTSISVNVTPAKIALSVASASLGQSSRDAVAAKSPQSGQAPQTRAVLVQDSGNKVSPAVKGSTNPVNQEQPVRSMSHMVESYNPQGKVRIRFEDSKNNVIYQIPPEMVAKTEDLMSNNQAATDIKG